MAKICLVSPHHVANNPRLVREATALAAAGYNVVAVTLRFDRRWSRLEATLTSHAVWRNEAVDYLDGKFAAARWFAARVVRRCAQLVAGFFPGSSVAQRSTLYGFDALLALATRVKADLYIAHSHPALPVAAVAAYRVGVPVAFDAEDLLAESPGEPREVHEHCEQQFVPSCCYVSTMSDVAAEYLAGKHALAESPMVVHNSFSVFDRHGIRAPADRPLSTDVSVYWFGQTIGWASRADQVVRAMPHVCFPFTLSLRGNPNNEYVSELRRLAERLGCADRVKILPVAAPHELVRLAADHDILLGSQPGQEQYTQLAIGNKVLAGLMAGLALLLTDTVAHRRLLQNAGDVGGLFADQDEHSVATVLNSWLADAQLLRGFQERAWRAATEEYNFEHEGGRILHRIADVLAGQPTP